MPTDTADERLAAFGMHSLIGEAGAGSNGEKLVESLVHHYPPALKAMLLRRPNERLMAEHGFNNGRWTEDKFAEQVKAIAGVPVIDACIRGGELSSDDAVVTYAVDNGRDVLKGGFPYSDLGKTSSRGHVSQAGSLAASPAARDHAHAQEKAGAAARAADAENTALKARIAELEDQLTAPPPKASASRAKA
jgi:hypothetical protein